MFVHNWEVCGIHSMTEITILVKVTMILILLIMSPYILENIGIPYSFLNIEQLHR
jgi:hypothetical protein